MRQALKSFINRAGPGAFDFLQRFFLLEDVAAAERRGRRIGRLLYRLEWRRRRRAIDNLELAFPEWSPADRRHVAKKTFEHFGMVFADFLRTPLRTTQEVLESVEVTGQEHFEQGFAKGKGIIACTAHFGNWERFGHWLISTGRMITVVARDANQDGVQSRVSRIRSLTGMRVLSRGDSTRDILKCLRNNEIIGILPDQNADETYVPFFGRQAGTVLGPAVLHMRTKAPLLPAYCVRLGPGKYRVICLPPIDPEGEETDPNKLTAQINAALESVIREYPEQWLWLHDRWRSARRAGLL